MPKNPKTLKVQSPNYFLETYEQIREMIEKANLFYKSYFGKDKFKKIAEQLAESLKKYDSLVIDSSIVFLRGVVEDKSLRSSFIYLRGKMANLMTEEYDKTAEEFLSKAVNNLEEY